MRITQDTQHAQTRTVLRRVIRALDQYRLQQYWSWCEVARDMARLGIPMSTRTLHHQVNPPAGARPSDRTLEKLRDYLRLVRARREHAEVARRARAVAATRVATP